LHVFTIATLLESSDPYFFASPSIALTVIVRISRFLFISHAATSIVQLVIFSDSDRMTSHF
jgi:hypothetical protein